VEPCRNGFLGPAESSRAKSCRCRLAHIPARDGQAPIPGDNSTACAISDSRTHRGHQRTTASPHLLEWQQILDHDKKGGVGPERFRHILWIHFYRNVVLEGRYRGRFTGRVEAIDHAFGKFLHLSEDSVKKLRLEINRRLGAKH